MSDRKPMSDEMLTPIIELSQLYAALYMIRGISRKYAYLTRQLDVRGEEAMERIADIADQLIARTMKASDTVRENP